MFPEVYVLYGALALFVSLSFAFYVKAGRLSEDKQSCDEELHILKSSIHKDKFERDKLQQQVNDLQKFTKERETEIEHVKWARQQLVDKLISARSIGKEQERKLKNTQVDNQRLLAQLTTVVREKKVAVEQEQHAVEEALLARQQLAEKVQQLSEILRNRSDVTFELSQARQTIEHLHNETITLQDRYHETISQFAEIVATGKHWLGNTSYTPKVDSVPELVQALQEHIRGLCAELERMKSDQDRLQQQLQHQEYTQQYEASTAQSHVAGLHAELAQVKERLEAVTAERDAAVAERNTAFAGRDVAFGERDTLQQQWDAAQVQRDVVFADRDAAVAERDAAVAEWAATTQQCGRMQEQLGAVSVRHDALQQQCNTVQAELDAAVKQQQVLVAERDALLADRDDVPLSRIIQADPDTARAVLKIVKAEHATLLSERVLLQQQRDALQAELDAAVEQQQALVAERDALLVDRAPVPLSETTQADLDTARAELNTVKAEHEILLSEHALLHQQCDALQAEVDASVEQQQALVAERDTLLADRATPPLSGTIQADLDTARAELSTVKVKNETLLSEYAMLQQQQDALQAEVDAAVEQQQALVAERDAILADWATAPFSGTMQADAHTARAELSTVKAEYETLVTQHAMLQQQRDVLQTELGAAVEQQQALVAELDALLADRHAVSLSGTIQAYEDAAQAELDIVKLKHETLLSEHTMMQSERETLQVELAALKSNLAAAEAARGTLATELELAQAMCEEQGTKIITLEAMIKELKLQTALGVTITAASQDSFGKTSDISTATPSPTRIPNPSPTHTPNPSPTRTPPPALSPFGKQSPWRTGPGSHFSSPDRMGGKRGGLDRAAFSVEQSSVSAHELVLNSLSDSVHDEISSFPGSPHTCGSGETTDVLAQRRHDVAELKGQLQEAQEANQELTCYLRERDSQLREKDSQLTEREEEVAGLQRELEAARNEAAQLEKMLLMQQEVVEELQGSSVKLDQQMREKAAECQKLREMLSERESEAMNLSRTVSQKLDECTRLHEALSEKDAACDKLQARGQVLLSQHLQKEVELLLQLRSLQGEQGAAGKTELQEQHDSVMSQLRDSQEHSAALEAKLEEAANQAEQWDHKTLELEVPNGQLQADLSAVAESAEVNTARAAELSAAMDALEKEQQASIARLSEQAALLLESEQRQATGEEVLCRHVAREMELLLQVLALKSELQEVQQSLESRLIASEIKCAALKEENEQLLVTGETFSATEASLSLHVSDVSSQLEAVTNRAQEADLQLQEHKQKLQVTEQLLQGTRQQLEETVQKLEETEQELHATKQQLEESHQELSEIQQQLQEAEGQLQDAARQLQGARVGSVEWQVQANIVVKAMVQAETKQVELAAQEVACLKEQLLQWQHVIVAQLSSRTTAAGEIASVESEKMDVHSELAGLRQQLQEMATERDELLKEVDGLKERGGKVFSRLVESEATLALQLMDASVHPGGITKAIMHEVGEVMGGSSVALRERSEQALAEVGPEEEVGEGQLVRLVDFQNLEMMVTEIRRDSQMRVCINESLTKFVAENSSKKVELQNELMSTLRSLHLLEEELGRCQDHNKVLQEHNQVLRLELDRERENAEQLGQQVQAYESKLSACRAETESTSLELGMTVEQLQLQLEYNSREEMKEEGRMEVRRELESLMLSVLDKIEEAAAASPPAPGLSSVILQLRDYLVALGAESSALSSPSSTHHPEYILRTPDSAYSNQPFRPSPLLLQRDSSTSSVGSVPDDSTPSNKQVARTRPKFVDRASGLKTVFKKSVSAPTSRPTTPTASASNSLAAKVKKSSPLNSIDLSSSARKSLKAVRKGSQEEPAAAGNEAGSSVVRISPHKEPASGSAPVAGSTGKKKLQPPKKKVSVTPEIDAEGCAAVVPSLKLEGSGESMGTIGMTSLDLLGSAPEGSSLQGAGEGLSNKPGSALTRSTADTEGSDFSLPLPPMEGHGVPSPVGSYAPSPRSSISSHATSVNVTPRESLNISPRSSLRSCLSPMGSPRQPSRFPTPQVSDSPLGSPSHPLRSMKDHSFQTRKSCQSPSGTLRPLNPVTFPELQHSPDSPVHTPRLSQSRDMAHERASSSSARLSATEVPLLPLSPATGFPGALNGVHTLTNESPQHGGTTDSPTQTMSDLANIHRSFDESIGTCGASSASMRMLAATGLGEAVSVSTRHTVGSVDQRPSWGPEGMASSAEISLRDPSSTGTRSTTQRKTMSDVVDSLPAMVDSLPSLPTLPCDDIFHDLGLLSLEVAAGASASQAAAITAQSDGVSTGMPTVQQERPAGQPLEAEALLARNLEEEFGKATSALEDEYSSSGASSQA